MLRSLSALPCILTMQGVDSVDNRFLLTFANRRQLHTSIQCHTVLLNYSNSFKMSFENCVWSFASIRTNNDLIFISCSLHKKGRQGVPTKQRHGSKYAAPLESRSGDNLKIWLHRTVRFACSDSEPEDPPGCSLTRIDTMLLHSRFRGSQSNKSEHFIGKHF